MTSKAAGEAVPATAAIRHGGRPFRRLIIAAAMAAFPAIAAAQSAPSGLASFSAALDARWNFARPAESELRFRDELTRWPAGDPQALVVLTQIARTQGLRREFAAAHATLDTVAAALPRSPSHVRVRYLLERGRTYNSAGSPAQAVPQFAEALGLAECNGDEFYAVDAAHMLGIAAPEADRLDWNLRALALAQAATDPRAARWQGALLNNIGWIHLNRADAATALSYFQQALQEYQRSGTVENVRIARWTVARALRSLGRNDDALAIQQALAAELDAAGATDGYVYEELALVEAARGDGAAARAWAAKGHAALAADAWFAANEQARLDRLRELAGTTR